MSEILVVIHVVCMILSLGLMSSATALAFLSFRRSIHMASFGFGTTVIGSLTGFALLFQAPVLSQCIILTGYLALVTSIYAVGFGWGDVTRARLLKTIS